jgi:hypothetical protein
MKNVARSLTDVTALLLEHDERDAVLGDLTEAGTSAWRSLLEVSGLVARRQLAFWYSWRPWLAAFGVSLPGSLLLMGASLAVSCTYQRLTGANVFGVCAPTGHEGTLLLLCHILLLFTWAWTGGFVVGSVSRRTLWVSVALCLSPCIFCLSRFHHSSVSALCLLLFLPPAILGVRYGLRMTRIRPGMAVALATVATVLMICAWGNQALSTLNWALIVPAWYIAAAAVVARSPGHGHRA